MNILPVVSYNIRKTNITGRQLSSPSSVSFKGNMREEEEKIKLFSSKFLKCLGESSQNGATMSKMLFELLKNESDRVKNKFLFKYTISNPNFSGLSIFEAALIYNPLVANNLWAFVKDSVTPDAQAQFLLGQTLTPQNTAFMQAVKNDEFDMAEDILKFIDSRTDKRLRERFFCLKASSEDGSEKNETQYDILCKQGFFLLADKFKHLALKYSSTNDISSNKTQSSITRNNESNKKTTNFKVYDNVKTRFSDVGGMFNVKNQIQNELLSILKNPKVKNADKPTGIILFGPPGTGKTLLATAIAGEAGVPFVSTDGSSFAELYVGSGASNVRKLYKEARNLAENHPTKTAIVFIDEVDAVGAARGDKTNSERDTTLNALLSEMDGVKAKENDDIKVITIMATNRKDMLDSAFRKGRVDLEFQIDDPRFSEKARLEILNVHSKNKPFRDEKEKNKMLKDLAASTSGFSGAELADVVKRAFRKTLYLGRENDYITVDDLNNAKLESLVGITNDVENTEYEQKTTIAHEAGHALNLVVMDKIFGKELTLSKRPVRVLDLIVNESRSNAAGLTLHKPSEYNTRLTIESLLSSVVVTYGGYSVEEKLFGCHTDGVKGDLENNTKKIFKAITDYGLGSKTKHLCVNPGGGVYELYKNDIKNDLEKYSNVGMTIANKIAEFAAPFIKEYTEEHLKNPVKVIKGEDFIKMFESWLVKSKNKKEFNNLCKEIKMDVERFRAEMAGT